MVGIRIFCAEQFDKLKMITKRQRNEYENLLINP